MQLTSIHPSGETFTTTSLKMFCDSNKLNRDTLMKFINTGKIPHPTRRCNSTRYATSGWEIKSTTLF